MFGKGEIAAKVATSIGSTKKDAEKALDAVIDAIVDSIVGGDDVRLAGLGTFKTKAMPERQGRNPATGAPVTIKASKKISFAAAADLKGKI